MNVDRLRILSAHLILVSLLTGCIADPTPGQSMAARERMCGSSAAFCLSGVCYLRGQGRAKNFTQMVKPDGSPLTCKTTHNNAPRIEREGFAP